MKKETDIVKKQFQGLGMVYQFDKKEDDGAMNKVDTKPTLKKYNSSNLICNNNHSFYKYHNIKKI